jgi:glycosyltransferase involved in cell wall biosynthesis
MNILVTIFNPVDLFPPTINAIEALAKQYTSITLLTNGLAVDKRWVFPKNVIVKYINNWPVDEAPSGLIGNITRFAKYLFKLRQLLKTNSFNLVLLYEPHAALAYRLLSKAGQRKKHVLWYHNHDIYEMSRMKKYSLGWFAARAEQKIFPILSVFTLPANERKAYFPMEQLTGRYFFLPNYPSIDLYSHYYKKKTVTDEVKLLYQGKITEGHGLEELIELLTEKIDGKKLTLHIKGPCDKKYISELSGLAATAGVSSQIFFYELTSYREVPQLAASCHIGIGIHTKTEIMHNTLGTSSNKIYEYAASGMPVLVYNNEHFREHLDTYSWVHFTDCTKQSLTGCIEKIISDYDNMSEEAYKNFTSQLNFETRFKDITEFVSEQVMN